MSDRKTTKIISWADDFKAASGFSAEFVLSASAAEWDAINGETPPSLLGAIGGRALKAPGAPDGNLAQLNATGDPVDSGIPASDIGDKATKVSGATAGNFASLDADGDLADSGIDNTAWISRIASPTEGAIPSQTSSGELVDTGILADDVSNALAALPYKATKVGSPTAGNLASLTAGGDLADSGSAPSDFTPEFNSEYTFLPIEDAVDGSSPPAALETFVAGNGRIKLRRFDPTTAEEVIFAWEMPDDADGSIQFCVCGVLTEATSPVSGEGISFQLTGYPVGLGESINHAFDPLQYSHEPDLFADGVGYQDRFRTAYSTLISAAGLDGGKLAVLKLARAVDNVNDDYAQDVGVTGIMIMWRRHQTLV